MTHLGKKDVYIGRAVRNPLYNLPESKWHNPFYVKKDDSNRDHVIARYETYIRNRHDLMAALPELVGKRLMCWCHPRPCHGDVLVKLLKEANLIQSS